MRIKLNPRTDKRVFRKTANRVHVKNIRHSQRGGGELWFIIFIALLML